MASATASAEVGLFSVLQLDAFKALGHTHVVDPTKQALVLLNDAVDCKYVINGDSNNPIVPRSGEQHLILIACDPSVDSTRRSHAYPRRLFCFNSGSFMWPSLMYRSPGAPGLSGPFETALVIMTDKLKWTSRSVDGRLLSDFGLPDPCRLYRVTAGSPDDLEDEVTEFGAITSIEVKYTGMEQGQCVPSGWPP